MMEDVTYLIGMKLQSGRERDLRDVADIIKKLNNQKPFMLISQLNELTFNPDISDLLDAYGTAYGIEWLEDFYAEHQQELSNYF